MRLERIRRFATQQERESDAMERAQDPVLHIETVLRMSGDDLLAVGWSPEASPVLEVQLGALSGSPVVVWVSRHPRYDVPAELLDSGFIAVIKSGEMNPGRSQSRLIDSSQQAVRNLDLGDLRYIVGAVNPMGDGATASILQACLAFFDSTLDAHVAFSEQFSTADRIQNPRCSIIIPVYGNFHLAQLLLDCLDNTSSRVFDEVILAIDNPISDRAARDWIVTLQHLAEVLLDIPIRCIQTSNNGGFARAVNAGVAAARAEYLAILNSDTTPPEGAKDPVGELVRELTDDVVAVAPLGLYPDGSVQHAGCRFVRRGDLQDALLVEHPGKGLPFGGAPQNPLLSGAILCCRRSLLDAVGGMPTRYGRGDFEDMEFILRAQRHGQTKLVDSQRWIHIEGASYGADSGRTLDLTLVRSRLFESWVISQGLEGAIHE